MKNLEYLSYLVEYRKQLAEEKRHLQSLRLKLVNTYFLILGGSGYLSYSILSKKEIDLTYLSNSWIIWFIGAIVVFILIVLGLVFATRTAHHTDVLRTDLRRSFALDELLFNMTGLPIKLPEYPTTSYTALWRNSFKGLPAEFYIYPIISTAIVFGYIFLLAIIMFQISYLVSYIISFSLGSVVGFLFVWFILLKDKAHIVE